MGTVYKKTVTKPMPAGANIVVRKGQRLAEWVDAKQKRRTAPVIVNKDGSDRIAITVRTYTAKYRDGSGIIREVPTGCRDEQAARSILNELETRAVRVKVRIITAAEDAVIDHQGTSLAEHVTEYQEQQKARELHPTRIANAKHRLDCVAHDCGWRQLADINSAALGKWLLTRAIDPAARMSAATPTNTAKSGFVLPTGVLTLAVSCLIRCRTCPGPMLRLTSAGSARADGNGIRAIALRRPISPIGGVRTYLKAQGRCGIERQAS